MAFAKSPRHPSVAISLIHCTPNARTDVSIVWGRLACPGEGMIVMPFGSNAERHYPACRKPLFSTNLSIAPIGAVVNQLSY